MAPGRETAFPLAMWVTDVTHIRPAMTLIIGGAIALMAGSPSWVRFWYDYALGLWRALRQKRVPIAWFPRGPAFLASKLIEAAAEIAGSGELAERYHEEFRATLEDIHDWPVSPRRLWCALLIFVHAVRIRFERTRVR
jgi:hypothetical protein